jgi:hypothetical protein
VTTTATALTERLPRLVGAALDRWHTEASLADALRQTLTVLLNVPDAMADAAFECGIDALRRAADAPNEEAHPLLLDARKHFASAEAAEEARDDAALYSAGVDALAAFARADGPALAAARDRLTGLFDRRASLLLRTHQPSWRHRRREAELAWHRLALILDGAARRLREPAWLSVWEAMDEILAAYTLESRSDPLPGHTGQAGFPSVIRPHVVQSLAARRVLLAQLRHAVEAATCTDEPAAALPRFRELLERIDEVAEDDDPADAEDISGQHRQRLVATAPTLLAELGEQRAERVAANLDDHLLRLVEGIAYNGTVQRALAGDPTVGALIDQLSAGLAKCTDYRGTTRHQFDLLLHETAMFLVIRHDLQRSGSLDYLKPFRGLPPKEAHLQNDFADWLRSGRLAGRVDVEVPNVATGRADIKISFGSTRFYIEIKRELHDASRLAIERSYATQAADYAGTSAALAILLVLDLTDHTDGVRHISECAWVTSKRPAGSEVDRYLAVGLVIGNRGTPSSYSP